jgi:hypothetical protein
VNTIRHRRRKIEILCDDPNLTPAAGLALVAELDRILGIAKVIDEEVGPIKARAQGHGAGGLLLSMAECMLAGGDFMCDLDVRRADRAGAELAAVASPPASTTFIALSKRFGEGELAGVEAANAALVKRAFAGLPRRARRGLARRRPTIDLDPTDVEVYGAKKEGAAYNYAGQRCYRPQPAVWAEAGVVLAASLTSGADDPRPLAPELIERAVAALPEGLPRPVVRADSGFFDKAVAEAALANGADFAVVAKRNPAMWRAVRDVPGQTWRRARGMRGAEVAEADYVPGGWPKGTRAIVRRVRLSADEISADPRSRRRRTIDPDQLKMVLGGEADHAYAYSVILTNLGGDPVEIETWFRGRAQVEERIKDSKAGLALRHLPSGYVAVNAVWMWSAFLGLNISAWAQALGGLDREGRAHGKRLRRELICVPGRLAHHARGLTLHLHPSHRGGPLTRAYEALWAMPALA